MKNLPGYTDLFMSPVTGILSAPSQLPSLQIDYIWVGDINDTAEPSPALIDVRLDIINVRHKIDSFINSTIILQTPNANLPNSQALNALGGGILKSDTDGVISIAVPDTDYMAGIDLSLPNAIPVFADQYGKKIKMGGRDTDPVTIDGNSNVIAEGLLVKNSTAVTTGFVAPAISDGSIYSLPATGGFVTQVLAILSLPTGGITPTFWMTLPGTVTKPRTPDDPYPPPVWIPIPDPVDPTKPPTPNPVTPLPPITPFPPFTIPIIPFPFTPFPPFTIPILPTPGGGWPDNSVPTYEPKTDDPNSGDPYEITPTDVTIDPTTGNITTPGGITTGGPTTTPEVVLTPKNTPTDTITIKPPIDVPTPYEIILPPEPGTAGQVITQGPNNTWTWTTPPSGSTVIDPGPGISVTGTPAEYTIGLTTSGINSGPYFFPNITFDRYGRATSASNPEAQQIADLIFGTFANFPGMFSGIVTPQKDLSFKIKSSYYLRSGEQSSASLPLLNRENNGYILKTQTQYGQNPEFLFQRTLNNNLTTLFTYDGTNNKFNFFFTINLNNNALTGLPTPQNATDAANKAYVDAHISSGTVTQINTGTGLTGGPITSSGTISLTNTAVTAGSYRFVNLTVDAQGRLTSGSSGSPSSTTQNTIPVWGNNSGTSLSNTSVAIDSVGNMTGSGSATFLAPQISNADGVGSLNFLSGSKSLQLRLSGSLANNVLWFLPTTNSSGFFKNNGSGIITWSTLSTSDIVNFSSAVTAFRLDQFAAPNTNLSLNSKKIVNLAEPTNTQDAATKNYVDTQIASVPGTGDITFSGDNIDSTTQGINFVASNVDFYQTTQFHAGIHVGPTYVSFARADPSTIFVFPLGGSLFVDLQSRLCFKDKNGNVAIIVTPP